ncbi:MULTISPECIES: hypothetical protein [unclassified Calothrix]|nr:MULTISPECIES: hypothetical protein [unclassified Calothrix]
MPDFYSFVIGAVVASLVIGIVKGRKRAKENLVVKGSKGRASGR